MDKMIKSSIVANYRELILRHGNKPEGCSWSPEGQRFRFGKLVEIGDLSGRRVLDIGCGVGAFYPFVAERFGEVDFTGIDLVPEAIELASRIHPTATFRRVDLFSERLTDSYDYVFLSGVFNNAFAASDALMESLLRIAYGYCRLGMGFNFISSHVSCRDPEMAYHDPAAVLDFCLNELSKKVEIHHHYERCDVAVFVYRDARVVG